MQQNRFIFSLKTEEFCESISSWTYAGTMKAYIPMCSSEDGFVLEDLVTSQNPQNATRRCKGCVSHVMRLASIIVFALYIYIYIYIFKYVPISRMYVCMHQVLYVRMNVYICIYVNISMYESIHIYKRVQN